MPINKIKSPVFLLFLLSFFLFPPGLWAQEDQEGGESPFTYGMNIGSYFPSNHTANFYNGEPTNENSIDLIIKNYYYRQQIEQNLGYVLDTVTPYSLPGNMRYTPVYSIGFYVRYATGKSSGFFAQFNYSKLKANDIFLLNLHLPQNYSWDPTYRQCPIWGIEKRVNIDLGVSKLFRDREKSAICVEAGLNFNNTRVMENKIHIENQDYSIINNLGNQSYIPGSQQQTYNIIQGGIGFGIFATGTYKLKFNENISMDPGATFYWQEINLGTYDGFKPAFVVFVRFVFHKL